MQQDCNVAVAWTDSPAAMSEFRSQLDVRLVDPQAHNHTGGWVLLAPLVYYSTLLRREITVPVGFYTDFASVPRRSVIAWGLFGGRGMRGAVVHDYLCRMHYLTKRERADKVFLEALLLDKVPAVKARAMYAAVAAYTATGLWKTEVDQPGFEPIG